MTIAGVDFKIVRGNHSSVKRPGLVLALILLAALAIRLAAMLTRQMVQFDETAYLRMAENLAAGNGLLDISGLTTTHFSPLLPILIAGVAAGLRDYVLSGYVVATLFGCLLLIPVFLLGRELFGVRAGLMAAALMAVEPFFVGTTEYIYTEPLYIFFLVMGLWAGWLVLKRRSLGYAALAGFCIGLAYLANPSTVFYLLAVPALMLVVAFVRRRQLTWAPMGRAFVVFILFCGICAVPYLIFLHGELGKWTFSGKTTGGNLYTATHDLRRDDIRGWEQALLSLQDNGEPLVINIEAQGENPLTFFVSNPVQAAKIFVKQTYIFHAGVLAQVFPIWLLPLVGLGMFARGWDRQRLAAVAFLLLMLIPMGLVLAMYASPRFFMPFVPFAMILAGEGWRRLEVWGKDTAAGSLSGAAAVRWIPWAPWLVGTLILLPVLAFAGVYTAKQSYPVQYKEAGLWLKDHGGEHSRILDRDFSSAYYAGGDAVVLPYADYDATVDYAKRKNVDYLIVSSSDIRNYRPLLERLLDHDPGEHPEWELIDTVRPSTDREVLVFRFKG